MTMFKLTDKQKEMVTNILTSAQNMETAGNRSQYYSAWCAVTGALSYVGAEEDADPSKTPVANAVEWIISKQNTDKSLLNGVNEMTTEQVTEQVTEKVGQTIEQALAQRPSSVWINHAGQFLIVSDSTTHTGHHIRGSFTTDLNKAYVGYVLPKFTDYETKNMELIAIPAWAERKVTIGTKPDGVK